MNTLIPLSRLIESLPLYEQKPILEKISMKDAKNINICFEDLWNCLSDFEKDEILSNPKNIIQGATYPLNRDTLDLFEEDDIISYVKDMGYTVTDCWGEEV